MASLVPVKLARAESCGFEVARLQYEYKLIYSTIPLCFTTISAPYNCTEMVLYSKFAYGSEFSREENNARLPRY